MKKELSPVYIATSNPDGTVDIEAVSPVSDEEFDDFINNNFLGHITDYYGDGDE
ncbi:hypothetical protein [Methylomonas koyamae]|uniref:hypothetical protein n=1 Tax=Methylomonas koyamae TaxID=702114 RepID=UPI0012F6CE30|nr:hypothetical protein [Methylomonas koyamae]BBL56987.1 hypothetical protein MKFW12EY_06000 [Methylomonas koyamae]